METDVTVVSAKQRPPSGDRLPKTVVFKTTLGVAIMRVAKPPLPVFKTGALMLGALQVWRCASQSGCSRQGCRIEQ
jgi:hypothetical protein